MNTNPQTRNKRIPMQERVSNFVECAVASGYANCDTLTRKEVYDICEQTGIVYPRWLAKNPDRRISRGVYSFPELKSAGSTTLAPDDFVSVDDATLVYTDVLSPDATITITD